MKVLDIVLDYEQNPVMIPDPKDQTKEKPLTWREVIFTSLNTQTQTNQIPTEDKMKAYELTKRAFMKDGINPPYSIEEKAFILSRIKIMYGPMVYGAAEEFFSEKKTA